MKNELGIAQRVKKNIMNSSDIADSIEAACFPEQGQFIMPRESWLREWCRQLREHSIDIETIQCLNDCRQRKGRSCLLSTNHCTRRAEDFYDPKD